MWFILIGLIIFLCFKTNSRAIGQENYASYYTDLGLPGTSHTVNLPINTTFECENKCMPPARCSITGEQCNSDIDCCGCNPNSKKIQQLLEKGVNLNDLNNEPESIYRFVEGFTANQLASAYGNNAKNKINDLDLFTKDNELFSKPPQYYLGEDMWSKSFYEGAKLFNDAHDPNIQKARYADINNLGQDKTQFQMKYPTRSTLSGLFVENGPLTIADV